MSKNFNCDKCPKSVQKTHSDFGHSRLNIAAMAMQGILSNIDLFKKVLETGKETLDGHGIPYRAVAKASFLFADALIAEAELTDKLKGK